MQVYALPISTGAQQSYHEWVTYQETAVAGVDKLLEVLMAAEIW